MIDDDDRRTSAAYQQALDPHYVRRTILYRTAAAVALLVVLLLVLLWLDKEGDEAEAPVAAVAPPATQASAAGSGLTLPAPSRSGLPPRDNASTPAPVAAAAPAAVEEVVSEEIIEEAVVPAAESRAAAPTPAPTAVVAPAPVVNATPVAPQAPTPAAKPAPVVKPPAPVKPVAPVEARPAPVKPVAPVASAAPKPPVGAPTSTAARAFRVQLKDYVALPELTKQKTALAKSGTSLDEMRRLVVTGYTTRATAEKAVERLKRDQGLNGFITADKNAFMVQVGVFSDPGNAEKLAQQLRSAGYKVQTQGRLIIGDYPTQAAAEQALASLRQTHRLEASILPPKP